MLEPFVPDREALEKLQSRRLVELLGEILPGNRFYAEKLAAADVDVASIRGPADLARVPFTTKAELQADQERHPPYGSNLSCEMSRYVRIHQTSGTSGHPIRWLDTAASWSWVLDCWERILIGAGVEPADRFFVPFGYGPFLGFWGAFESALRAGHLTIAGGGMSSVTRLRWIVEHGVTVVTCTPTYALRLASVAAEEGVDLASSTVRLLIVAGEPGGSVPQVRQRLESLWGARVSDHWGMTEVGPLGFEPVERPGGMHLFETDCIAEIVNPESGEPVAAGEEGELVLTSLGRSASPLLRYRTGDRVRAVIESVDASPPRSRVEALRRGAPFVRLEGGILARADQMALIRGNNVYPAAIDAVLASFPEVREYSAEVVGPPAARQLVLKVEIGGDASEAAVVERLTRAVKDRMYLTPRVESVPVESLPRFEFKARRFRVVEPGEDSAES